MTEPSKRTIKHTVNGDEIAGWYCYQCQFFTRNVQEAAEHDGQNYCEGAVSASPAAPWWENDKTIPHVNLNEVGDFWAQHHNAPVSNAPIEELWFAEMYARYKKAKDQSATSASSESDAAKPEGGTESQAATTEWREDSGEVLRVASPAASTDAILRAAYKICAKLPNPDSELGRVQAIAEIIKAELGATQGDAPAERHAKKWAYTKQRDSLKKCPFCGTAAIEQGRLADNSTDMHYRITCGNPFCELDCATKVMAGLADAERVWQTRESGEGRKS